MSKIAHHSGTGAYGLQKIELRLGTRYIAPFDKVWTANVYVRAR